MRARIGAPCEPTSVTSRVSRSVTSSKSTVSSKAWLSVSWTTAIAPTRRTASSSATRPSGTSIRRACSRSRAATVWRLFFTRWWISRMVASLVTSSRSRRRRSVTSRSSTSPPVCSPVGLSGIERRISVAWCVAELGVARHPAAEHGADRLLVGAHPGRHQLAGLPGQRGAAEVAGQPELAVDRLRVGAGVGHVPLGVHADEPVADARGVGVVGALPREREGSRGRSSARARWRSGGRTARAGSAYARPGGWCCGRPRRSAGRRGVRGWPRPAPVRRHATPGRPRARCARRAGPSRAAAACPPR